MASSLMQPVALSLVNALTTKGVMRSGKGQEGGFLPLLALLLVIKVLRKGVVRAGRGHNNMDHMNKNLVLLHPLNNIEITKYFNYERGFNGVFLRDNLARIKDGAYIINLDNKQIKETN